jgi:hypothetical protein
MRRWCTTAEIGRARYRYFVDEVCGLRERTANYGLETIPRDLELSGDCFVLAYGEQISVTTRRSLWAGYLVTFAVSAPALAVEESWQGRPMIDSGKPMWIPFAVWAAVAFAFGAALVADTRRKASTGRGMLLGMVMTAVLVGCDLFRRFTLAGEGISFGVIRLLFIASVGAIALSGLSGYLCSEIFRRRIS